MSFERFWEVWPRKVAKQAAQKAWDKLQLDPLTDAIIGAVRKQERYQWQGKDRKYIPHPASWLNAGRWEDEVEIPTEKRAGARSARPACRVCHKPGSLLCPSCASYQQQLDAMSSIRVWANRILLNLSVKAGGFPHGFAELAYRETQRIATDFEAMDREGLEVSELPAKLTARLRALYRDWRAHGNNHSVDR